MFIGFVKILRENFYNLIIRSLVWVDWIGLIDFLRCEGIRLGIIRIYFFGIFFRYFLEIYVYRLIDERN